MTDIIIDTEKITDKASFYDILASQIPFPSHFGRNLDALNDVLSEAPGKYRFVITDREAFSALLGPYADSAIQLFSENGEVVGYDKNEIILRRNTSMAKKIRVTVWNEYRHEVEEESVRAIYPKGIHGLIKEFLDKDEELEVRTATLDEPDNGLPDDVLNNTDVLIWWGHMSHDEVPDELVERIRKRVVFDGMGFVPLHSAHMSKPFRALMGTDCSLSWGANVPEIIWTVMKNHPVAEGVPEYIHIEAEETYGEPFCIPQPDEQVFISWYKNGYVFRSGCAWYRGMGKIFYFQPGHEYCRSFYNEHVQRVIRNAVHWVAPINFGSKYLDGPHIHSLTKQLGIEPKKDEDDID